MITAVKCCDYILTPMAGGILIAQIKLHNVWIRIMLWLLPHRRR